MNSLVICCDGTWNTPDQEDNGRPAPTNVFKLYAAFDLPAKYKYYREGVGTSGGLWSRVSGGRLGAGLGDDIKSAYKWLCAGYIPQRTRIYLFGFSRGAYAVRSLAGLIGRLGVLDFSSELPEKEKWSRVERAYKVYRARDKNRSAAVHDLARYDNVEITFLGVCDTVGALGIPDEMFINFLDRPQRFQFHDTNLGEKVRAARHALAIDEKRQTFSPTLWTNMAPDRDVKQEWFAGVHGDVGGSYAETGLGDAALDWMIKEAQAQGLAFKPSALAQIKPDSTGVLHNSVKGIFGKLRTRPRNVTDVHVSPVHGSAQQRVATPPLAQADYWPTVHLDIGGKATKLISLRGSGGTQLVYTSRKARSIGSKLGESGWMAKSAARRTDRFQASTSAECCSVPRRSPTVSNNVSAKSPKMPVPSPAARGANRICLGCRWSV